MENVNVEEKKPIIVLKNVYGHKDSKCSVHPVKDGMGWYKGIEKLSEEEKKEKKFWIDPDSAPVKEVITHNVRFDLNDSLRAMTWEWVQHVAQIAPDIETAQKMKAYYYIDNKAVEDKKAVDADDLLLDVLTLIKNDRDENLVGRARVLGFNREGDSPTALRRFLNKMAKDKATVLKVHSAYTANSMQIQLLFLKAIDKKVITQTNGIFMYGTAPLGPTEESCVKYLQDPLSRELVLQIERDINPASAGAKGKNAKKAAALV
jgi:hypothetical protein